MMNPFKTKYAPNFKVDWGEEYSEATYPSRKVAQIELFDLKKYVTEEKRKKMMGGTSDMGMPNPQIGPNIIDNPFAMNSNKGMMQPGIPNQGINNMPNMNSQVGMPGLPSMDKNLFAAVLRCGGNWLLAISH